MSLPRTDTFRTAIHLKKAIDYAPKRLRPIGFCPTLVDRWNEHYEINPSMEVDEEEDEEADEKEDEGEDPNEVDYKALMKELRNIKKEHFAPSCKGILEAPFSLTITRTGCEFAGEITPIDKKDETDSTPDSTPGKEDEAAKAAAKNETETLLKKWFDAGDISGYGDVKAQETKVDPSVRNAREIPAAEFTVAPELLQSIQKHWAAHFFPTLVRVEPYKIHMYGPGGKFQMHRDTPETDLVGTFLVGLGDSTGALWEGGAFEVEGFDDWERSKADPGTWVAFYPDVRHQVTEVRQGYRAVMAFKVFRLPGEVEDAKESVVQLNIKDVLDKMSPRYGLLLERKYCKGTVQLSGFDAHLFEAAKARTHAETYILPVLIKFDGTKDFNDDSYGDLDMSESIIFPLMEPHVDALVKFLTNGDAEDEESSSSENEEPLYARSESSHRKKPLKLSLKGTEAAWIEEYKVTKVPFYSPDVDNSLLVWRNITDEGAERTGNESRPYMEDSIYLSYAMVVLPKQTQKRKRESDEEGTSALP